MEAIMEQRLAKERKTIIDCFKSTGEIKHEESFDDPSDDSSDDSKLTMTYTDTCDTCHYIRSHMEVKSTRKTAKAQVKDSKL